MLWEDAVLDLQDRNDEREVAAAGCHRDRDIRSAEIVSRQLKRGNRRKNFFFPAVNVWSACNGSSKVISLLWAKMSS